MLTRVLIIALLTTLPLVVAADGRTDTQSYVLTPLATESCASGVANPINRGVVCFRIRPGETSVTVQIADDLTEEITGGYEFSIGGGVIPFCSDTATIPLPPGANVIRVYPGQPNDATGGLFCPSVATVGTITAVLR